jgi:hypothetical protein
MIELRVSPPMMFLSGCELILKFFPSTMVPLLYNNRNPFIVTEEYDTLFILSQITLIIEKKPK